MTFPLMILTIGVGLTLLVALLMLALILRHRKKLQEISDQLAEGAVDDGKTLKRVVQEENAATRLHVSHAVDGVRHDTENIKIRVTEFIAQQTHSANEFRGQLTTHKSRLQWIIGVLDKLGAQLHAIVEKIHKPK